MRPELFLRHLAVVVGVEAEKLLHNRLQGVPQPASVLSHHIEHLVQSAEFVLATAVQPLERAA